MIYTYLMLEPLTAYYSPLTAVVSVVTRQTPVLLQAMVGRTLAVLVPTRYPHDDTVRSTVDERTPRSVGA